MRKILLILASAIILGASALNVEKRIYEEVLRAIFPEKRIVKVWSDSKNMKRAVSTIRWVHTVSDPDKADILLVNNPETLKKIKEGKLIIFVGSYTLLKEHQDMAIGGFFWQKGRPNLVFIKRNIERFDIKLPKKFEDYVEDRV